MAKFKLATLLVAVIGVVTLSTQATDVSADMSDKAIKERIKPVAQVTLAGAQQASSKASTATRNGEQIYKSACFACHATGALGAPKKGDAAAWQPRIKKGMDVLLQHAVNGFNAMPPKGTCADCSDDELKATIEYMIKGIK